MECGLEYNTHVSTGKTRDVLNILKRKSFLTRILQNFVLTEPWHGIMSRLSDDYFSGQLSGNLDHSVAH